MISGDICTSNLSWWFIHNYAWCCDFKNNLYYGIIIVESNIVPYFLDDTKFSHRFIIARFFLLKYCWYFHKSCSLWISENFYIRHYLSLILLVGDTQTCVSKKIFQKLKFKSFYSIIYSLFPYYKFKKKMHNKIAKSSLKG